MKLANELREGKIALEYRLIRGVLVDWGRRCRESGADFKDLAGEVRSTRAHVLLQIGDMPPSNNSIKRSSFSAFVRCEADYLQALSKYSKRYTEALRDSQGNQMIASDLPTLWANFKDKPDVDSARLYHIHAHRYSVLQTSIKDEAIEQKLDGRVEFLGRLMEAMELADQDE